MHKSQQFKVALALANMTLQAWAKSQGVTYHAVLFTLSGKCKSARLSSAIVRFINQEFQKLPALSTSSEEVSEAA
jgi:hypothetical protein